MSDLPFVVVFKDRTPLTSGNKITFKDNHVSQDFLRGLDVKRVEFFQRLEGNLEDYSVHNPSH